MFVNKIPYKNIEVKLPHALYGHQPEAVANGLDFKHFINGDDMGLGKTIESIVTVLATGAFPALVICPASLKYNWQDEWDKWTDKKAIILNDTNKYTCQPL